MWQPRSFVDVLGALSGFFAQPGTPEELWVQLKPWMAQLMYEAAQKWRFSQGKCEVYAPCPNTAVTECQGCRRAVCLHHGRPSIDADMVCEECIRYVVKMRSAERAANGNQHRKSAPREEECTWNRWGADDQPHQGWHPGGARQNRRSAPPDPEAAKTRQAYKTLGLPEGAGWQQIHAKFRELSVELHPDRHQTARAKRRAEAKFKKASEAYHHLERARKAA